MRNKLFAGALALAMTCTTVFSGVAPATVKAASVSTVQTQATKQLCLLLCRINMG